MLKRLLYILVLLVAAGISFAGGYAVAARNLKPVPAAEESSLETADNGIETTADIRNKQEEEYSRLETEMKSVYEKLLGKAWVSDTYAKLEKSQKAWRAFEKSDDDFAYDTIYNQDLHGTSGGVMLADIRIERIKHRLQVLKQYLAEAEDYWDPVCDM